MLGINPSPVTPKTAAEGSARFRQLATVNRLDGLLTYASRGSGALVGAVTGGSNWALGGEGVSYVGTYKGRTFWKQRGGVSNIFEDRIDVGNVRPQFSRWYPYPSLYRFAGLMAWPDNTTASPFENGFLFSYLNNSLVLNAQQGWLVMNDAGVVTLAMRGPAGLQTFLLSTALQPLNPQEINLLRTEWRQPTKNVDGSVKFYVNDDVSPRIQISTADANWPAPNGGSPGIGMNVCCRYDLKAFYFADLYYDVGPDTTVGM